MSRTARTPILICISVLLFATLIAAHAAQNAVRISLCDFVIKDGRMPPAGECRDVATEFQIPSEYLQSGDSPKQWTIALRVQATPRAIGSPPSLSKDEEKLTGDTLTILATNAEVRLRADEGVEARGRRYGEAKESALPNFRIADIEECVGKNFVSADEIHSGNICATTPQFLIPAGRSNIYFDCLRPWGTGPQDYRSRWCTATSEFAYHTSMRYLIRRDVIDSGQWVSLDERYRIFLHGFIIERK